MESILEFGSSNFKLNLFWNLDFRIWRLNEDLQWNLFWNVDLSFQSCLLYFETCLIECSCFFWMTLISQNEETWRWQQRNTIISWTRTGTNVFENTWKTQKCAGVSWIDGVQKTLCFCRRFWNEFPPWVTSIWINRNHRQRWYWKNSIEFYWNNSRWWNSRIWKH